MRKLLIPSLALAAAAALALAATAAGARTSGAAQAAIPGCAKGSLDLLEDGVLTVGADNPAFPPWFGGDEKTKPWKVTDPYSGKGYESAVAYAIAKQLGFTKAQVKWTVVPFNNSYRPGKKPFDVYITQVSYTPERAKAVDFSKCYYFVNQSVVGRKGTPIASVKSIAGAQDRTSSARRSGRRATTYITNVHQARLEAARLRHERRRGAGAEERPDRRHRRRPADRVLRHRRPGPGRQVIVGKLPTRGTKERFGVVLQKGNTLTALREQGARPALAERHDQEAPEDVPGARTPARPSSSSPPEREPQLADPRRRDRPRLEGGADGRDRSPLDGRLRDGRRRDRHPLARLGRVQGVLPRLGASTGTASREILDAFWLNVKLFLTAEAVHPPGRPVRRGAPLAAGAGLLPAAGARDRLRRPLPRHPDDPRDLDPRLRDAGARPLLGADLAVLLGRRRARARLHGLRVGGLPLGDRVGAPEPGGSRAVARALRTGRRCASSCCRRPCGASSRRS